MRPPNLLSCIVCVSFCPGCVVTGDRFRIDAAAYHDNVPQLERSRSLQILDSDGDNEISHAEWRDAQGKPAESRTDFNRIDKDGDGSISGNEWFVYVKDHVRFGKLSERGTEHYEAEPTFLKLKLFSFPVDRGGVNEAPRANPLPGQVPPENGQPVRAGRREPELEPE